MVLPSHYKSGAISEPDEINCFVAPSHDGVGCCGRCHQGQRSTSPRRSGPGLLLRRAFSVCASGTQGLPVAAVRANASKLPLECKLDNSAAINFGNTLSQHKQVMLVARVSKSGNPMAQPGDLEGTLAAVKVGATGVKIMIDQTRA